MQENIEEANLNSTSIFINLKKKKGPEGFQKYISWTGGRNPLQVSEQHYNHIYKENRTKLEKKEKKGKEEGELSYYFKLFTYKEFVFMRLLLLESPANSLEITSQ